MKKKRYISICFALVFLAFTAVLDYPFVAQLYNERVQGTVAESYGKSAGSLEEEQKKKLLKEAEKYNVSLWNGGAVLLPDAFEKTQAEKSSYTKVLNTDKNGVMGTLEIPGIDVFLPIYHGTAEAVLQKGAGHLEGSSLPVGGENTHTCISAHRGLPEKCLFTDLDLLKEGDVFYLCVLDRKLAYQVYGIETVTPDRTEPLAIKRGEDLATLITCTPYGINTHRMYVHGKRIPFEEAKAAEETEAPMEKENFWKRYGWAVITAFLLLWLGILLYLYNRTNGKKEKV